MKKFLFFRRALLSLTVLSIVAALKNVAAAESIRFREAAKSVLNVSLGSESVTAPNRPQDQKINIYVSEAYAWPRS
ncbi:MAG: hypothetical protein ACI3YY_01815 [Candidatus Cryptobacteroides sp.]